MAHVRMSHVTRVYAYTLVPLCIDGWRSHVTHTNESRMRHGTHGNESCHTFIWKNISAVTQQLMNVSCHLYERVMSHSKEHIRMSHGTCEWVMANESWHRCECVRKLTHDGSCYASTFKRITSHIRMSHGAHTNESCHTYGWVMAHSLVMGTLVPVCINW